MSTVPPVTIILDRPKSPENVGGIFRSALALGGPDTQVVVCAPRWPLDRFPIDSLRTDPSSAHRHLNVWVESTAAQGDGWTVDKVLFRLWQREVYKHVVLVERGLDLSGTPTIPLERYAHPTYGIYVFGPEDGSIEHKRLWRWPIQPVEILGHSSLENQHQSCLNLATCASIVLYDRLAKLRTLRFEPDVKVGAVLERTGP